MIQRKTYTVTLTTRDPFRIGGKPDPLSEADNPIAVVGGRPCIPGPSLKGAYRDCLERWLNDHYFDGRNNRWKDETFRPCIPSTQLSSDEQGLVQRGRFRDRGCAYAAGREDRRGSRPGPQRDTGVCPACYLLGAQGLVGFVNVPFLFSTVSYESLYSARLERTSHTVMRGANRAYQLIPPDTEFVGELEVLIEDDLLGWKLGEPRPLKEIPNADAWLMGKEKPTQEPILKEFIVDRFEAIDRLGGYRSKGFGKVSIRLTEKKT